LFDYSIGRNARHLFYFSSFQVSAEHMETTPQSWSDVPVDLAGLVLSRLYNRVRFAAVCP
jgi:hypothetical protein